jgi:hypothetical protein
MQSHQLNSTPLKPEIQAILDIAEIQGVPVWYENGVFMVEKIHMAGVAFASRHRNMYVATQNVDTVLRWIEEYKKWNKNETY